VYGNHLRVRERKRERRPLNIRLPELIVAGMDTRNEIFPGRGLRALATQSRRFDGTTRSRPQKKKENRWEEDMPTAHHLTTIRPQPPYHTHQKHPIYSIRLLVRKVSIELILSRSMCLASSSFRILPSSILSGLKL
jgi:hypothetical protein